LTSKPYLIATHKEKLPYLLAQDKTNQLYFIDHTGKLIWKKKLESALTTPVFTLDVYKNKKLQYLFATTKKLHLLDYTGQEIKQYPHKLPALQTPFYLNIVDYKQDNNYRILFADANGNIYLKDIDYRPLPGWNPRFLMNSAFVYTPFHFRQQKDYFFSLQESGKLHALNRRAQIYPGFPIDLGSPTHNAFIITPSSADQLAYIFTLTDEGSLKSYNLAGELQNTLSLEKNAYTTQFVLCPELVAGNNFVIVRQDLDKIVFLDSKGEKIFELPHELEKHLLYQYYAFGNQAFYIITDLAKQKSNIYNTNGALMHEIPIDNAGFPLELQWNEQNRLLVTYSCFGKQILKYTLTIPLPPPPIVKEVEPVDSLHHSNQEEFDIKEKAK